MAILTLMAFLATHNHSVVSSSLPFADLFRVPRGTIVNYLDSQKQFPLCVSQWLCEAHLKPLCSLGSPCLFHFYLLGSYQQHSGMAAWDSCRVAPHEFRNQRLRLIGLSTPNHQSKPALWLHQSCCYWQHPLKFFYC